MNPVIKFVVPVCLGFIVGTTGAQTYCNVNDGSLEPNNFAMLLSNPSCIYRDYFLAGQSVHKPENSRVYGKVLMSCLFSSEGLTTPKYDEKSFDTNDVTSINFILFDQTRGDFNCTFSGCYTTTGGSTYRFEETYCMMFEPKPTTSESILSVTTDSDLTITRPPSSTVTPSLSASIDSDITITRLPSTVTPSLSASIDSDITITRLPSTVTPTLTTVWLSTSNSRSTVSLSIVPTHTASPTNHKLGDGITLPLIFGAVALFIILVLSSLFIIFKSLDKYKANTELMDRRQGYGLYDNLTKTFEFEEVIDLKDVEEFLFPKGQTAEEDSRSIFEQFSSKKQFGSHVDIEYLTAHSTGKTQETNSSQSDDEQLCSGPERYDPIDIDSLKCESHPSNKHQQAMDNDIHCATITCPQLARVDTVCTDDCPKPELEILADWEQMSDVLQTSSQQNPSGYIVSSVTHHPSAKRLSDPLLVHNLDDECLSLSGTILLCEERDIIRTENGYVMTSDKTNSQTLVPLATMDTFDTNVEEYLSTCESLSPKSLQSHEDCYHEVAFMFPTQILEDSNSDSESVIIGFRTESDHSESDHNESDHDFVHFNIDQSIYRTDMSGYIHESNSSLESSADGSTPVTKNTTLPPQLYPIPTTDGYVTLLGYDALISDTDGSDFISDSMHNEHYKNNDNSTTSRETVILNKQATRLGVAEHFLHSEQEQEQAISSSISSEKRDFPSNQGYVVY